MTKIKLGSVSEGTMLPEDLIPAFVDVLDDIREELAAPGSTTERAEDLAYRVRQVSHLDDFLGEIEQRMEQEGYFESEDAAFDLDELTDKLNEHAPPFCYFGSHEGDGACYGFWISWDSLNDECECGNIVKVPAGDEWPEEAKAADYVLEATDHGNGTLYTTDRKEVWSVV